jgi:hypothetical protein
MVRGFEQDVFVSYAHENNQPRIEGQRGWVDQFVIDLELALREQIGRPAGLSIWMDRKLHGNQNFENAIDDTFQRGAVFLSIVSPSYVQSPFCRCEWEGFVGHNQLRPESSTTRIFKVLHIPLRPDQADPFFDFKLNGYQFYAIDPLNPRNFEPFRRTGEMDSDQRYWTTLRGLAADLGSALLDLEGAAPNAARTGPTVYLAEVTPDLAPVREEVRAFLDGLSVNIVPRRALAGTADPAANIRPELAQAALSIHLSGVMPGAATTGGKTLTQLQFDLAQERAPALARIVWLQESLAASYAAGQNITDPFLNQFRQSLEPAANPPAVITGLLEVLKDRIRSTLYPASPSTPVPTPRANLGLRVYVACEPSDQDAAQQLSEWLYREGLGTLVSLPSEDLRQFKNLLNSCHGLLLVYCHGSPERIRERALEATKAAARRKKLPMRIMTIYDGPPPAKQDLNLRFPELPIMNCRGGFDSNKLSDFLRSLRP